MPGQNLLRRPLRRGSYRLGKSIYCVAAAICFRIASGAADPLSAALNKVDRAVPCSMLKQMRQAANVYEAYARDRRICFRQARRRDTTFSSRQNEFVGRRTTGCSIRRWLEADKTKRAGQFTQCVLKPYAEKCQSGSDVSSFSSLFCRTQILAERTDLQTKSSLLFA